MNKPPKPESQMGEMLNDIFLRRKEVERIVGLSRPTIYRLIKLGMFPKQIHLGTGSVRWRLSEITAWQSNPSKAA